MSNGLKTPEGVSPEVVGPNLISRQLPLFLKYGVRHFFPEIFDSKTPLEVNEANIRQQEVAEGLSPPVEKQAGGEKLKKILGDLVSKGYEITLEQPESESNSALKRTAGNLNTTLAKARRLIIDESTIPFLYPPESTIGPSSLAELKVQTSLTRHLSKEDLRLVLIGGIALVSSAAVIEIQPVDFQNSEKAFKQLLKNLIPDDASSAEAAAVKDAYGPEVTREELEKNPQLITATDYVNDAKGDVIKQRVVVKARFLYESVKNPTTGLFSDDFKLVSIIPMGNVTSLISSGDGNTLIAGGEDPIRSANTKLAISYDGGKAWTNIAWPYQQSGSTIDLIRFTDNNYLGNNGNWEGGIGQFIISIDPVDKTAGIKAASLATAQTTNFNIGSAHDLRVASVNGANVQMYSAGSLSLQEGFVKIDMNYLAGIGTAKQITQTIISGQLINLGYFIGTGVYTDTTGNLRLEGSNYMRQVIYDINPLNPLDGTATQFHYANLLDNKGIPNYIPGSLTMYSFGSPDAIGNKTAHLGGGYGSNVDGLGRAIVVNRETLAYHDLSPNNPSGIGQRGFQRKKINGQLGYEVNIFRLGKVFIPDGGSATYTDRGLGSLFNIYLPSVTRN